jgi:hypothetical protein
MPYDLTCALLEHHAQIASDHVNLEPPSGSRVSVTTEGAHPLIVLPHGSGGLMRYFVGLFLLAWLGKDAWKVMLPKRLRLELDRQGLQSLRLSETNVGNRLTVDVDASRLDIAQSASEMERVWLYQLLAKRYSLPLAPER